MATGLAELKVPQRRVFVEVASAGLPPRRLQLSLAEQAGKPTIWEEVLALLEGDRTFLPCRNPENDRWLLVNRARILWVAIFPEQTGPEAGGGEAASLEVDFLFDQRRRATIEVSGGTLLYGDVLYAAPAEHARLADHLNGPDRFLCLFQDKAVYLVAKAEVIELIEGGVAEAPAGGGR